MNRNKLVPIVVSLLIALLVIAYIGWFFANYEQRERLARSEASPDARRNPFLAAEHFLNRIGIPAESVKGRDRVIRLPSETDALVINNFATNLPPDRHVELVDWIERGGHLVLTPPRFWNSESKSSGSRLLDQFGIRLVRPNKKSGAKGDVKDAIDQLTLDEDEAYDAAASLVNIKFSEYADSVSVAFRDNRTLADLKNGASVSLGNQVGAHLLQLSMGDGRLTVLSDNQFLKNRQIGKEDHALFLSRLVDDRGKVWLLYSSNMPSLPALLWANAPELLLSTMFLLGLLIWWQSRRSGPLLQIEEIPRRNIMEHLQAAAHFEWKKNRGRTGFKNSRESIGGRWNARVLALRNMSDDERCEWLATRTGLTPAAVQRALHSDFKDETEYAKITSALQVLAANLDNKREQK